MQTRSWEREAARPLSGRAAGVVFAFFDAEEPPWFLGEGMGSIRFFHDQMRPEGVQAALVMDLVGHDVPIPVFESAIFVTGAESHPALPGVLDAARAGTLPVVAAQNRLVGDLSDHHVFREHGFPYLFFSCGRWAHYHKPSDTPDRLSYEKMDRVRALLQGTIRGLAGLDLPKAKGEGDTTAFEIRLLSEAAGESLPPLLRAVGLQKLETRRDMDRFARAVQGRFGL